MARVGKIARLPLEVRAELNRRLADGRPGPELLPWLNGLPETQAVLASDFGGAPINAQNLSDWRHGGFEDWLKSQDRFHQTRLLAERAAQLAQAAGGNLAEGSAAILSGRILELLEAAGPDKLSPDEIAALITGVSKLRSGDIDRQRTEHDRQRLAQKDEELALAREKFQRESAEITLRILADDRAKAIESGPGTHEEKIQLMGAHIFGDLWRPVKSAECGVRSAESVPPAT
jgi:hypothetical protein